MGAYVGDSNKHIVSADPLQCPLAGCPAPPPPAINGYVRWSSPSTWPTLVLPAAGESVVIPADKAIILDMSPPPLGRLIVYGKLSFLDGDNFTLTAESIVV